ncbi:hypothetical protein [Coraliomargarita parva]|uniref:hypothetical protein n=1 Tax=Coraliomargarita parva TaxID=3014050 RepID=UPI0022B47CBF|nr:hypothetical protein [Coraliomargarita parva]
MNEKEKPWVRIYDPWGDAEGSISGNKEGLTELKKKIEQALSNDHAPMEELDCDFECVVVRETKEENVKPDSATDRLLKGGCLVIVATCILIFGYGLISLWETLTQ